VSRLAPARAWFRVQCADVHVRAAADGTTHVFSKHCNTTTSLALLTASELSYYNVSSIVVDLTAGMLVEVDPLQQRRAGTCAAHVHSACEACFAHNTTQHHRRYAVPESGQGTQIHAPHRVQTGTEVNESGAQETTQDPTLPMDNNALDQFATRRRQPRSRYRSWQPGALGQHSSQWRYVFSLVMLLASSRPRCTS
jgi:hypothetical protein